MLPLTMLGRCHVVISAAFTASRYKRTSGIRTSKAVAPRNAPSAAKAATFSNQCAWHAVVCIDTEPDAGNDSRRHVQRRNSGEARHVFRWCTETRLVAPKEDVCAAVDEYNRVNAKRLHKVCVALSDRPNAKLFEGINPDILSSLRKILRQCSLRKIQTLHGRGRLDRIESRRNGLRARGPQGDERQIGEMNLLPKQPQSFVDWESGVYVEAAAGTRHEDALTVFNC